MGITHMKFYPVKTPFFMGQNFKCVILILSKDNRGIHSRPTSWFQKSDFKKVMYVIFARVVWSGTEIKFSYTMPFVNFEIFVWSLTAHGLRYFSALEKKVLHNKNLFMEKMIIIKTI